MPPQAQCRSAHESGWLFFSMNGRQSHLYATPTAQSCIAVQWRAHAQATSECVHPCSSPFSHQQRSQRISPQLSLLLRIDRGGSPSDSTTAIHARDAALQKLWTISALRSRSGVETQSVAQNLPSSPPAGLTTLHRATSGGRGVFCTAVRRW